MLVFALKGRKNTNDHNRIRLADTVIGGEKRFLSPALTKFETYSA